MKRLILSLFLCLVFLLPAVAGDLDSLLKEGNRGKRRAGIIVKELKSGRVLYEKNKGDLFIPASNMKLLTTAAALEYLGVNYEFRTEIASHQPPRFGVLKGDLWVRGAGDPNISGRFYGGKAAPLLRAWAAKIKHLGISKIEGDLVVDDRLLDRQWVHPDWPRDQLHKWYCAEVSSLSLNDNCVDLYLKGGRRKGDRVKVTLSPNTDYVKIRNLVKTSRRTFWVSASRQEGNQITLRGYVPRRRSHVVNVAIHDPPLFFGHALKRALTKEGIVFRGQVRRVQKGEKAPTNLPLVVHVSRMANALPIINKRSQNLHSEILFKLVGKKLFQHGTFSGGAKGLKKLAQKANLSKPYAFADGSGMSRNNKISPQLVADLLIWIQSRPYGEIFRRSLSLAGRDGTLRRRLRGTRAQGRVYGKTGTLNGVSAVSGYAWNDEKQMWYVFSILTEGFSSSKKARSWQDRVILEIITR